MNEEEFARLARQYVQLLDRQNDMRPPGWSQVEHTGEHEFRVGLLRQMRDALTDLPPTPLRAMSVGNDE